jgi:adenylate kinase
MNIIFLGAPGSGKGTQAEILSNKLSIKTISTGEVLRKEVQKQSEVGILAKSCMDSGKLVPDELVINIIKNCLSKGGYEKGFILDGFPRNISQAEKLDEMLGFINKKIELVFNFEVEEEVLIKRILGRFSCKNCGAVYNRFFKLPKQDGICDQCSECNFESRSDDTEETINNRLKVYRESTEPLIEYYKKNNLLFSISGIKSPPLISEELVKVVYNFSK